MRTTNLQKRVWLNSTELPYPGMWRHRHQCAHGIWNTWLGEDHPEGCDAPAGLLQHAYLLKTPAGLVLLNQVERDGREVIPASRQYADRHELLFTTVMQAEGFHAGVFAWPGSGLRLVLLELRAAYAGRTQG